MKDDKNSDHKKQYDKQPKHCKHCKIVLPYIKRRNIFCDSSCAGSYNNTGRIRSIESKKKISIIAKIAARSIPKKLTIKSCQRCGCFITYAVRAIRRKYCSTCLAEVRVLNGKIYGKLSAEAQNRRSKNEMLFAKLCEEYFNDVLTNEIMFNGWDADVIINNIKYAVLWNGVWHYKKK